MNMKMKVIKAILFILLFFSILGLYGSIESLKDLKIESSYITIVGERDCHYSDGDEICYIDFKDDTKDTGRLNVTYKENIKKGDVIKVYRNANNPGVTNSDHGWLLDKDSVKGQEKIGIGIFIVLIVIYMISIFVIIVKENKEKKVS